MLAAALAETEIQVASAGTGALVGSKIEPRVAGHLSEAGLRAEDFRARQLTSELARDADLLLCATREHRSLVVRMEPSTLRRTFALADFSDIAVRLAEAELGDQSVLGTESGSFVRQMSVAATRARGEVRARTAEEAAIVDPFRRPEKVVGEMVHQVDALLRPIVSVLTQLPVPTV
jgi:protein-tyrosine phosphatase